MGGTFAALNKINDIAVGFFFFFFSLSLSLSLFSSVLSLQKFIMSMQTGYQFCSCKSEVVAAKIIFAAAIIMFRCTNLSSCKRVFSSRQYRADVAATVAM